MDTSADPSSAYPDPQARSAGGGTGSDALDPPLDPGQEIHRVADENRSQALSLLLTGRLRGGQTTVEQFLAFARNHDMELDRFWLLTDEGRPTAAALVVAAAGRAGMLFLSPVLRDQDIPAVAALTRHVSHPSRVADLALVQMLLDPHQQREFHAVTQAGYSLLAKLQYMRRRTERQPASLQLPDGLSIAHWSPEHRPLFEQAILESYQNTLDCPGLLGLRGIDDIIAGHMSAGEFEPSLWHVVHQQGKPAAVMLLSPLSSRDAMELVYLGLSPAWRGRGLARMLMEYALRISTDHGSSEMLLAVDENNTPALKLYQSLKFTPTARKLAMLRAVIKAC